jgi:hypothetical protein
MKTILKISFFILGFNSLTVFAQQDQPIITSSDTPFSCYRNQLELDSINQAIDADKLVIVIAQLGKKDLKSNLNKRRLHNIYTYWTEERKSRESKTIILAEGERVNEKYGRIEFYIRGELFTVLKVFPNSDFVISNCYSEASPCSQNVDKLYYPCKDKKKNRKK